MFQHTTPDFTRDIT